MKKSKLVLYGHGGSKNHGCEAIVRGTAAILLNRGVSVPVILGTYRMGEDIQCGLSSVIKDYVTHRLVKKYSYRHFRNAFLRKITGFDANAEYVNHDTVQIMDENTVGFSIGGDNYCYGFPHNWIYLNKEFKAKGARTVFWGCSVEPELLKFPEIIEDMHRYDLITPRESVTYEALISAGVTKNTHLFPDPAFVLKSIELPLPDTFVPSNTVGINVSPLIMGLEKGKDITHKNYSTLIHHLLDATDMHIALIPHVTWEDNNDLEPLTALFNQFKESGRVVLIGDHYNCMELKGFISRCRFFVGARTHATIAAYSTCVPTLVVGYSVKARGIARDIFGSEENMVIPVQSLEQEDDLVNAFKYIQENEDSIRQHLQDFMPSYIERAWQAGEEVKKLLEK